MNNAEEVDDGTEEDLGVVLQGGEAPNVTDGAGKDATLIVEEDVAAEKVQGDDISILLKGKDAMITTLKAKLALEVGDRVALEKRNAALEVNLRAAEERARASEERANKMKDVALLLMG